MKLRALLSLTSLALSAAASARPAIVCDVLPAAYGTRTEMEYVSAEPSLATVIYAADGSGYLTQRTNIISETMTCFANTPALTNSSACRVTKTATEIPGDSVGRHELKFDCGTISGQLTIEGEQGDSSFFCGYKARDIHRRFRMTNCRQASR